MKKNSKEKIGHKPGLYWFYTLYLGYACFFFLTWCVKLPLTCNWIDKDHNPIIASIDWKIELSFCVFYILTLLWIVILFFAISYKKKVFYRKWLKQTLWIVFFIAVLAFSSELIRYLTRPTIPDATVIEFVEMANF